MSNNTPEREALAAAKSSLVAFKFCRRGELWEEHDEANLALVDAALAATPPAAPAPASDEREALPMPGSPEASAMIDSMLEARGWPASSKGAARAGYEAARRMLAARAPQAAPSDDEIEFGATPPPAMKNPCRDCGGSGLDGDAGEQGQAITIDCSACHGTGEAQAVPAPQPTAQAEAVQHWCTNCMGVDTASCAMNNALSAPPVGEPVAVTAAARDVLAERQRQVSVEGWTPEHDDEHTDGSLSLAATAYLDWVSGEHAPGKPPWSWPSSWDISWFKPRDNRRNLVKAGALILAEIERLDRAAPAGEKR